MGILDIFKSRSGRNSPDLVNAAIEGDLEQVRILLSKGSNPNSADPNDTIETLPGTDVLIGDRKTALNYAAERGFSEIVGALLTAGADPNLANIEDGGKQWSPLLSASYYGHYKSATLLIDAGADVNYFEPNLKYAVITHAANGNNIDIVLLLLKSGADIRKTPDLRLCFACGGAPVDIVATLNDLKNGDVSLDEVINKLERYVE